MSTALAFIKRDATLMVSYRFAFVVQLAIIFVAVPFFYFSTKLVAEGDPDRLAAYGGDPFAFALIGFAFLDYSAVSLKRFNESIRESQLMGTLEISLLSPSPISKILLYSALWGYTFSTIRLAIYILLGMAFGLRFPDADFFAALVMLLLSIVAFASLGIMVASVTMVVKKSDPVNLAINFLSLLIGGVFFPTKVMPGWLEKVSLLLPIRHSLDGVRAALLRGASVVDLWPQMLSLLAFAAVLFPLGLWCFSLAVEKGKRDGTIDQY